MCSSQIFVALHFLTVSLYSKKTKNQEKIKRLSKTNSELMKRYEKRTKKQPKIKKQNQKKSKKYEKTQNKKHPKK